MITGNKKITNIGHSNYNDNNKVMRLMIKNKKKIYTDNLESLVTFNNSQSLLRLVF